MTNNTSTSPYGEILVTLDTLLQQKGISSSRLSTAINCDLSKFNAFRRNRSYVLHSDLLARLCYALDCDLSDLIVYIKPQISED